MILPLRHALCARHPLTAAVSLCRFATSPSHCEGVDPNKWGGLRNGQDRSLRVVGAIHESPACHSEPLGEESRFVYFYFVRLEILRYRAGGQIGVSLSNRRGGFPRPPVDFDVILRNGQCRFGIHSKSCGGSKPPPYHIKLSPKTPIYSYNESRRRITSAAIYDSTFGFK